MKGANRKVSGMISAPMPYLASRRIRYNRSGTILITIAVALTACLLMTVGTIAGGMTRFNKVRVLEDYGNYHGSYAGAGKEQLNILKQHMQTEAMDVTEVFGDVSKDKMNAVLIQQKTILPGIHRTLPEEGRLPEKEDEIAGASSFFERLGYPEAGVGDKITLSFRVQGKGEILTRDFVISGILPQRDRGDLDIADTRLLYSAMISEELAEKYLEGKERDYQVYLRLRGEENYNYDTIFLKLQEVAADVGIPKSYVNLNSMYAMWVLAPSSDMLIAAVGISALIITFSVMVIYSLYYVSIISNVKELGKLKALGAKRKQMRGLLLWEGLSVAGIGIPIGLLGGYLISCFGLDLLYDKIAGGQSLPDSIMIFSMPITLFAAGCSLLTVILSLMRPMKLAGAISPIEALRYREQGSDRLAERKGHIRLNVRRLAGSNLSRNRRRTTVTLVSMGLGGILFLSLSGVMSSMKEEDYLRQYLRKGDFNLSLRYHTNDDTYPENNLDSLQAAEAMGGSVLKEISSIPGVEKVEVEKRALALVEHPGFRDKGRIAISSVSREEVKEMEGDLKKGTLDYDELLENRGVILTYDRYMEEYGLSLYDKLPILFSDGGREKAFEGTLMGSADSNANTLLMIPEELFDQLLTETEAYSGVYVYAGKGSYDQVKEALEEKAEEQAYYQLMSYDEEYAIARSAMEVMRYGLYLFLGILGFIILMNFINTMITSIVTRRREIACLQALGMSEGQLLRMLWWEGGIFTAGTFLLSVIVGNGIGYGIYRYWESNGFMGVKAYHFPFWQNLLLLLVLGLFEGIITELLIKKVKKESLVDRMRK